jgi:hypothetical protein
MNKNITSIQLLSLLVTLFFAVNVGFGQIIAWEMGPSVTPNLGNEITVDATTLDGNLSISTLSRGSGIDPSGLLRAFSSANFTANGTQADAITNNEYLQFEVSASIGYQVSLSTLDATFRRSSTGPNAFIWRYSIDGINFNDIGTVISFTSTNTNGNAQAQIDLSVIPALQNVLSGTIITFRLYGWGATATTGTFAIGRQTGNDLSIDGTVTIAPPCPTTTTWTAGAWDNGTPTISTNVIIADNYDTATSSIGSFSACSLTVNAGFNLNVANGDYVEVENDVVVDGQLFVQTQANFVQNSDTASFTDNTTNGVVLLKDKTSQRWYSYTYWSSPVVNETVENALGITPVDRRFYFNAANYIDVLAEIGNTNTFVAGSDGFDDDGNDWQPASGLMVPGVGYAATAGEFAPFFPITENFDFYGEFNNGEVLVPLINNSGGAYSDWNFIGNPYPGAISADTFFTVNAGLVDVIYLWDQATPPSSSNGGSQASNFSADDYAMINGTGTTAGAGGTPPNRYIPSAQGFFVEALAAGNVTFNNSMRSITADNSQFFKVANTKENASSSNNGIWVNLTSDNGVFNQVMIGYVNGATNNNDGSFYDAPKNTATGAAAILYSTIEGSNKVFAIQGKAPSSLNENEVITLGFNTNITVATQYTLSIAKLEGDFLNSNTVYLKDNLLNTLHDLSTSDYTFTSEVGEFTNRFEIVFNAEALSTQTFNFDVDTIQISQVDDTHVSFKASNNLNIKTVSIYDLLGRQLYQLEGNQNKETYNLSNLKNAVFIAKVELSNGAFITKKAIKK